MTTIPAFDFTGQDLRDTLVDLDDRLTVLDANLDGAADGSVLFKSGSSWYSSAQVLDVSVSTPAATHWRIGAFTALDSILEFSELQLFDAGNNLLSQGVTPTANVAVTGGNLSDLTDGSFSTRAYWTSGWSGALELTLVLPQPESVTQIAFGTELTVSRAPSGFTVSYSTDGGTTWTVLAPVANYDSEYNGASALGNLVPVGVTADTTTGLPPQRRVTGTVTTSSLADSASEDVTLTGIGKAGTLLQVTTDRAAWVVMYCTTAARTADSGRDSATDPDAGSGVLAEVLTTGAETVVITPALGYFNLEATPVAELYLKVENRSGGASTVQVDVSALQSES